MAKESDDLQRVLDLLEITTNTARDVDMAFSSIQQTVVFVEQNSKTAFMKKFSKIEESLYTAYMTLATRLEVVDAFKHVINELLLFEPNKDDKID